MTQNNPSLFCINNCFLLNAKVCECVSSGTIIFWFGLWYVSNVYIMRYLTHSTKFLAIPCTLTVVAIEMVSRTSPHELNGAFDDTEYMVSSPTASYLKMKSSHSGHRCFYALVMHTSLGSLHGTDSQQGMTKCSISVFWNYTCLFLQLLTPGCFCSWTQILFSGGMLFCRGISSFENYCPCGNWHRGSITCIQYVILLLENHFLLIYP